MSSQKKDPKPSTLAALLKEKPKRGRPRHSVSRQNVYVSLSESHKESIEQLAEMLPAEIVRADVPDLAITILVARMDALHRAVADRSRAIPEGITDLDSLYLLWDLSLPSDDDSAKWTSIRVSPQHVLEFGRVQGTLKAAFGANRSQIFCLGLSLLEQYLEDYPLPAELATLNEIRRKITKDFG